jgi:hypothetical protein
MRQEIPPILIDTPAVLRTLVRGFGEEILQWRPNADRWSAAMVIAHLAEAEVVCFRTRLQRIVSEDSPVLEPYDQWAFLKRQSAFWPATDLDTFRFERAKTLELLKGFSSDVLNRHCIHQKLGQLTFRQMLNEFAFHDGGHDLPPKNSARENWSSLVI